MPERGVVVIGMIAVERAEDGEIVHAIGHKRKQRADLSTALAVTVKLPLRTFEKQLLVSRPIARFGMIELDRLAVIGGERAAWDRTNRRAKHRRS